MLAMSGGGERRGEEKVNVEVKEKEKERALKRGKLQLSSRQDHRSDIDAVFQC